MTEKDLAELIAVVLLSSLKMGVGGIPMSYMFKFNLLKSIFSTTLGGCIGTVVFVHLGDRIVQLIRKWKRSKIPAKKNIFSVRNKMIVRVKRRYGLPGIAIITPLFLSYPLGCLVATRFFRDKKKVIAYLCASTAVWSILLSLLKIF